MRVLLIEDEPAMGKMICAGLKQYNYTVDWLKYSQVSCSFIKTEIFDVLILDLELSKQSGLDFLKRLREEGYKTPILVLAGLDQMRGRIQALHNGADDCVTKPPNLAELSARLQALQRRSMAGRAHPSLIYRDLVLNPNTLTVTLLGKPLPISRREFALLQKLLENVGRVVSREALIQCLYGWKEEIDSNTLEVHTHNLRKKLTTPFIKTIRGVGYLIESEKST
jgi:two-component system response regulator QseB